MENAWKSLPLDNPYPMSLSFFNFSFLPDAVTTLCSLLSHYRLLELAEVILFYSISAIN